MNLTDSLTTKNFTDQLKGSYSAIKERILTPNIIKAGATIVTAVAMIAPYVLPPKANAETLSKLLSQPQSAQVEPAENDSQPKRTFQDEEHDKLNLLETLVKVHNYNAQNDDMNGLYSGDEFALRFVDSTGLDTAKFASDMSFQDITQALKGSINYILSDNDEAQHVLFLRDGLKPLAKKQDSRLSGYNEKRVQKTQKTDMLKGSIDMYNRAHLIMNTLKGGDSSDFYTETKKVDILPERRPHKVQKYTIPLVELTESDTGIWGFAKYLVEATTQKTDSFSDLEQKTRSHFGSYEGHTGTYEGPIVAEFITDPNNPNEILGGVLYPGYMTPKEANGLDKKESAGYPYNTRKNIISTKIDSDGNYIAVRTGLPQKAEEKMNTGDHDSNSNGNDQGGPEGATGETGDRGFDSTTTSSIDNLLHNHPNIIDLEKTMDGAYALIQKNNYREGA